MDSGERLTKELYIFGNVFILANKLQAIGDRRLGPHDLTAKQWLLTAVVDKFGADSPTLGEVAEMMGSSHQNVKQIALKLQEKGFLAIERDERDSRVLRLRTTAKSAAFWQTRQVKDERFIIELFQSLSPDQIEAMTEGFNRLYEAIGQMDKRK